MISPFQNIGREGPGRYEISQGFSFDGDKVSGAVYELWIPD